MLLCLYSADEKGLLLAAAEKEVMLLAGTASGSCHPSGLASAAGEPRIEWKLDYVPEVFKSHLDVVLRDRV